MQTTASHCPLCGTFHPVGTRCPDVSGDLIPGYADSPAGMADAKDQAAWDAHTAAAIDRILGA